MPLDGEDHLAEADDHEWEQTSGRGRRLGVLVGAALAPAAVALVTWRVLRRGRTS